MLGNPKAPEMLRRLGVAGVRDVVAVLLAVARVDEARVGAGKAPLLTAPRRSHPPGSTFKVMAAAALDNCGSLGFVDPGYSRRVSNAGNPEAPETFGRSLVRAHLLADVAEDGVENGEAGIAVATKASRTPRGASGRRR